VQNAESHFGIRRKFDLSRDKSLFHNQFGITVIAKSIIYLICHWAVKIACQNDKLI